MHCFDTDVLSAIVRGRPPAGLVRRLALLPPRDQATTAVNLGELVYGARKARSSDLAARVESVIRELVTVLPVDAAAARRYGEVRAALESAGKPLAGPDLWIASVCLARDATLVSGNTRHFARIPGLRVENWLTD